jgi:hypothetical protein
VTRWSEWGQGSWLVPCTFASVNWERGECGGHVQKFAILVKLHSGLP